MNIVVNNFKSYLTAAVSALDTEMQINDELPALPDPSDYYTLTLFKRYGVDEVEWEIVKVVAVDGTTLTVERGQEGTSPLDWDITSFVELRITAGLFNSKAHVDHVHPVEEITGLNSTLDNIKQTAIAMALVLGS
jgi:hypothetical protein